MRGKRSMRKRVNIFYIFMTGIVILWACNQRIAPVSAKGHNNTAIDTTAYDYLFVEAVKQKLLGNIGDAVKIFEQCLKADQKNDAAYFQIAQILMGSGDTKRGKEYGLKAFNLKPDNFWYMMFLAGSYYSERNLDSATIFYEKAIKSFPAREDLQMNLGNLYAENKRYDKALQVFEIFERKYGVNENTTVSEVKVLMAAGKMNEAEDKINKLLVLNPDDILYNGLLAEIYAAEGKDEAAIELYDKLISGHPDNGDIQLSLFTFLLERKKYDDLLILLNKIILNNDIAKELKVGLFNRLIETDGFVQIKGNELQLASMIMESVYKDDNIILIIRPEILEAMKKYENAISRLEEIIFAQPDYYMAWEKLLFIYLDEKDYKNLEEKGELCATKFNRSFVAKILYANAAMENKNYDIALEELRKASILAGEDKDMMLQVLTLKADLYYRMKNYNDAFKTFDEALANNSSDLTILNNYAYYLAEQNSRLKDAEEMAKKVTESEKDNTTYLDTYAWVLYKRGKAGEARKIMQPLLEKGNVSDAELYEHYGFIMKKLKDCNEAVKNWQNAIKIDSAKVYLNKEIENCKTGR